MTWSPRPVGAMVLAMLAASAVSAQPLTLELAVSRALETHPALASAEAAADEAVAAAGQVAAQRWPTLGFSTGATQYQKPMAVAPIHGFTPELIPPFERTHLQAALQADYTLFDGFARGRQIDSARARAGAAGARRDASEKLLITRVARTYLEVLSTNEVLAAQEQQLVALQAEHDRAIRLLESGRAARVEVLRVEAAIADAEADHVRLAATLDVAEQDLARLIDAPLEATRASVLEQPALADTVVASRDELVALALARSPRGEEARAEVAAADAGRAAARGARWPAVDLFGNWIDRNSPEANLPAEWSTGVALKLPLFTGGAIRQNIARADAAHRGAGEALRATELEIAHDIDRARTVVTQARALVRSLETAEARFAEVARIEKLALDAGSGTQTDYLDAEASLFTTRARLTEARNAEILARVELARTTGELGPEWIAAELTTRATP